jgi:hypothetical protein
MTSISTSTVTRLKIVALVAVLATLLSFAFATDPIRVVAGNVAYKDASDSKKPVTTMALSLTCDGGPTVVVNKKGSGSLGDITVRGYPVEGLPLDALERINGDAAALWVGAVTPYPGGVTFAINNVSPTRLMATTMAALANGGCSIADGGRSRNAFGFTNGGTAYRAVFNTTDGGTLVYLGR